MQNTELLHRFFDEGLEESLEDILFERMAMYPDLRREFLQHLKLHSIIQEDVTAITTPSHVSQQLFVNLGLTPPQTNPVETGVLRRKIGFLAAGLRTRIAAQRRYLYTALISAAATAVIILGIFSQGPSPMMDPTSSSSPEVSTPGVSTPGVSTPEVSTQGVSMPDAMLHMSRGEATDADPALLRGMLTTAVHRNRTSSEGMAEYDAVAAEAEPLPRSVIAYSDDGSTQDAQALALREMRLEDLAAVLPDEGNGDDRWHFFRPGPQTNILSNLVFELRKLYGQSFPDVDLPHNSHRVFEDMAFSAVYKVTDHHAFGFEYGREAFGRVYQDRVPATTLQLDESLVQLYVPPESMLMRDVQENRMLDLFGAVWKLSLPEYGIFGIVYPYMRSFVGATRLG
ncbi:MAG: hypothetical protein JXA28_13995, partial [Bacteroidetes bacterium]|nr:hypothetical protein [Bacteroidota bacterium]